MLTDKEGYLKESADWSPQVAQSLAQQSRIELTEDHWEILHLLRRFYANYGMSPNNRGLVKAVAHELGTEKGNSIHLMQLFPQQPAKLACKLAGLPKPANCI